MVLVYRATVATSIVLILRICDASLATQWSQKTIDR